MIKFTTKAELLKYINEADNPREGRMTVDNDETLQNEKSIYSYLNGTLILESGTTVMNWLPTVDTHALLLSTYPNAYGLDSVIVTTDENHNNNKTWYKHNGYNWIYKGAYHKRETYTYTSLKGTRSSVLIVGSPLPIEFEYIVGNKELDLYLDGVLSSQYLKEYGDLGFTSKAVSLLIDVPVNTDITVRKFVANIDDEPRTNDDTYIAAFKHNYDTIEKFIKYERSSVIHYDTFAEALNDTILNKENQVIRTHGHVTKNDGRGRYWILETTDKDFAFKTKSGNYFINRLVGVDELPIGSFLPVLTTVAPNECVVGEGQLVVRNNFKRIWAWAVANGWVVTEAEWAAGKKGYFSSGDGVNTFRFPDFRDRFIRVKGSLVAAGTAIADTYGSHNHSLSTDGAHTHTLSGTGSDGYTYYGASRIYTVGSGGWQYVNSMAGAISSNGAHSHTVGANGSTETAPKYIAEPYYIKI